MIEASQETNAVGFDEGQLFDDFASFCQIKANQNRIALSAALLSEHKLNVFKEILKLLSKAARIKLISAVCDVCLVKNANFSKARNKDLPLNTKYIVGKGSFVFYVGSASSVPNNQDEFMLKIFVLTIGHE